MDDPRTPITTNAALFHRWYAYRDERTSSSSSESGVASLQFSPPGVNLLGHPTSVPSTVMALSPPGLSPLHVYDSAFSTPTLSSSTNQGSRFTFDHVPFRRSSDGVSKGEMTSAFDLPLSSGKDIEKLKDILKAVRKQDDDSINKHPVLQRKESVIQSTRSVDSHLTIDRSESLPIPPRFVHQLSVSVPDNTLDKILNGQYLLYTSSRHSMLSPSLSSPLSSGESYRLGTSPNYLGVSPNSLEALSSNFVIEAQKSPGSISSDVVADDEDKKQYYCSICKKDFKRPDILSRHLRRHTGEKPFGCDACGRYFSRSDHLRTHRRTHTDEKPYQCTICPYAARRRDVLTRHMSTRHQAKAGLSIFQRHRDVRRCLSDGDEALCSSSSRPTHHSPSPSSPKRIRHTTEVSPVREKQEYRDRTLTEIISPRDRHITETSQDEIPSLNEIEDDVIVDVCDLEEEDDYYEDDEEAEVEE